MTLAFRAAPTTPLRERLVAAAVHVTSEDGWAAVTMARLADLAGVSRQTVYNEIGTKADLAEAVVAAELARFLDVVTAAFASEPDDLGAAVRVAVRGVLDLAAASPLLRAVVAAGHGAETDLLPLLTTRSGDLVAAAAGVVDGLVAPRRPAVPERERAGVVDVVVRTVLSHVMQPAGAAADPADTLARIAVAVLGPEPTTRRPGRS